MNKVYINLKEETDLNENFEKVSYTSISAYINCDQLSSWIGYVESDEDVMSLIDPQKIRITLDSTLSCDELEIFDNLLHEGTEYYYYDKSFKFTNKYSIGVEN